MFDPHYWPSLYPGIFIGLAMGWSMGGWVRVVLGGLGGLAGAALGVSVAGNMGLTQDFASFAVLVVCSFSVAYILCCWLPRVTGLNSNRGP